MAEILTEISSAEKIKKHHDAKIDHRWGSTSEPSCKVAGNLAAGEKSNGRFQNLDLNKDRPSWLEFAKPAKPDTRGKV